MISPSSAHKQVDLFHSKRYLDFEKYFNEDCKRKKVEYKNYRY